MSLNVELLRSSFEKAKPLGTKVTEKFYEFLFEDYPQVTPMFEGVNMRGQQKALLGSLEFIIDHLEDGEKLTEYLHNMGRRHVAYGTTADHYPAVGNSLIKTFAHFFGDDWTEELQEEWIKAYGVITELMLEGASFVKPDTSVIKKRARLIADQLLLETIEEGIGEELRDKVRETVRKMIFEVMEEEAENLIKKAA